MKEELIYGRYGTERMTVEELNPHLKIFHQLTTGGYAPPMKGSLPWSRGRDTALYRSRWQVELLFKRFK